MFMPVTLTAQADLQRVRESIDFCYFCGKSLSEVDETDRDHVVPKNMFAKADRINPLILDSCRRCNHGWRVADSLLGEIFARHNDRKFDDRNKPKLTVQRFRRKSDGHEFDTVSGVNLRSIVQRLVRGFHAALYCEYLPENTMNDISIQFPAFDIESQEILEGLHPIHLPVASRLRVDRLAKSVDSIDVYNGKCQYICSWDRMDNGVSCCIFALRLYEWEKMADRLLAPNACCVGLYAPPSGRPKGAARSSGLISPIRSCPTLSPFED